nr:MAG TPA: hypothetical protein [Caudoviricetes sp.]
MVHRRPANVPQRSGGNGRLRIGAGQLTYFYRRYFFMEYASKGLAGTALGFGIGGAALGLANGGLGNLLGGLGQNNRTAAAEVTAAAATPAMAALAAALATRQQEPTCSENMPVTRYDLEREQKLAAKDSEIALLKANTYNDGKMLEMYGYIDGQLKDVREALCKQAVHNQRTEDSFALVKQDVESVRKEALDAVKMEAERRCCGDNSIVTYVNATFYPKQVADVTTGTATTAQTLYNPIPKCGGCCNS